MGRSTNTWGLTTTSQLHDDQAWIYLPQGDLTANFAKHMDAPVVLYQRQSEASDGRGSIYPIWGYYLGGEATALQERIALANLIFQGMWVAPITSIMEEDKDSTGEGLPFNDGSFLYNDQAYRIEITGAYPRYPSGVNLRELYGRASSKLGAVGALLAPRVECLTCDTSQYIYVGRIDDPIPHAVGHTWSCWFPAGWPGSQFPNQPIARLSPLEDGPEAMTAVTRDVVRAKAAKFRNTGLSDPVCLIIITQGFPLSSSVNYLEATMEEASHFDMVLSVHIDGHIGFMENESFSYESVATLLKCPLCNRRRKHRHTSVFTMIRHQFNDAGTWAIHGTTNRKAHLRVRQATWGTPWHHVEPRLRELTHWLPGLIHREQGVL